MGRIVFASVSLLLVLAACRGPTPAREPSSQTTTTSAEMPAAEESCAVVCGSAATVAAPTPEPDYHAQAVADADRVFAAMRGDLLACYRARVATYPQAHASLYVDVVIGSDGDVRKVETTGGALLGDRTMRCITSRVERARFAPVRGGGTLRIQVPLTFSRTADENI